MANNIKEWAERRASYYGDGIISVENIPEWQRRDIAQALKREQPTGSPKHIGNSLTNSRKVACGAKLSASRSNDVIDAWTFEMLHQEGRTDLCLSCMRRQRRAWAGLDRPTYCAERQPAQAVAA